LTIDQWKLKNKWIFREAENPNLSTEEKIRSILLWNENIIETRFTLQQEALLSKIQIRNTFSCFKNLMLKNYTVLTSTS
jgi:hypothetical protein